MEEPVDEWDTLILRPSKLDLSTKPKSESKVISDNLTTVDEPIESLSDRSQLLETVQANKPLGNSSKQNKCVRQLNKMSDRTIFHLAAGIKSNKCPICNEQQKIDECQIFPNLSATSRHNESKRYNRYSNCRSKRFSGKRNSLLHRDDLSRKAESEKQESVSTNVSGMSESNSKHKDLSSTPDTKGINQRSQTLNAYVTNCAQINLLSTA